MILMHVLAAVFCVIVIAILVTFRVLKRKAIIFMNICAFQTERFMTCQISLDEYCNVRDVLLDSRSFLLKWYMKRSGILTK